MADMTLELSRVPGGQKIGSGQNNQSRPDKTRKRFPKLAPWERVPPSQGVRCIHTHNINVTMNLPVLKSIIEKFAPFLPWDSGSLCLTAT